MVLVPEFQVPENVEADLLSKMANRTQFLQDIQAKMDARVAEARKGVSDATRHVEASANAMQARALAYPRQQQHPSCASHLWQLLP